MKLFVVFLFLLTFLTILLPQAAMPHGGGKHEGGGFTPLQALQKAIGLYYRLITSGRLGEKWETALRHVQISVRNQNGDKEFVVSFTCSKASPDTVYFFFKANGEYAGSNFSGK
ncbi:MAG: hypothetical protein JRH18_13725 [Deltaproteobacteria bacterium]|nr:hypothetical protein [Deltaproteobacteria bacterium]MBW1961285.1 hypothetical protein [Deltaproteobacteria bacterium]MBW2152715.1 hypothetical protein [Deltaproteobacteria bacterium]